MCWELQGALRVALVCGLFVLDRACQLFHLGFKCMYAVFEMVVRAFVHRLHRINQSPEEGSLCWRPARDVVSLDFIFLVGHEIFNVMGLPQRC